MVIGSCSIELRLPGNGSLKDKRRTLKSVIARLHNEFNVAVAEVDGHDSWTMATLGVACVSTNAAHAHQILEHVVAWIEHNRLDVDVLDYHIEIL
jgi:uncharacterized protein YlxP (DUF503 family)